MPEKKREQRINNSLKVLLALVRVSLIEKIASKPRPERGEKVGSETSIVWRSMPGMLEEEFGGQGSEVKGTKEGMLKVGKVRGK